MNKQPYLKTDNDVKIELNSRKQIPKQNNISFNNHILNSRYGTNVSNQPNMSNQFNQFNQFNQMQNQTDKYTLRDKLFEQVQPNQLNQFSQIDQSNQSEQNNLLTNIEKTDMGLNYRQYRVSRINVDSRYRNIDPKNIISRYIKISNPFKFTAESNILEIQMPPNHGLNINDYITINNVNPTIFTLRANSLSLQKNSQYLYINHPNHGFVGTSNIITINGVKNLDPMNYFFGNIPLSVINTQHNVILILTNDVIDPNNYLVDLGIYSNSNYVYSEFPFTINVNTFRGININLINASYPINANVLQGYQIIYQTGFNWIQILLQNSADSSTPNGQYEGGINIQIGVISSTISGYPDPSYYKFELKKTYYKVKKLRLVSTEIPNTEMLVKNAPTNLKNNALYWQIQSDGEYIYSINISPGNYDANSLQIELTTNINKVSRQFGSYVNSNLYYPNCIPNIILNASNNLFSMQILSTIYLSKCIVLSNDIYSDQYDRINITHPLHNLTIGDKITISGAVNVLNSVITSTSNDQITTINYYIPTEIINSTLTIESVNGINNYICKLPKYNPTINGGANQTYINGGNAISITFPLAIQLLFSYSDTLGNILGYSNVGDLTSNTLVEKTITNNTQYIGGTNLNSVGLVNTNVGILNFRTYPYLLMVSDMLVANINYKNSSGVFAKLFLTGNPGSMIYDQYVQITEDIPISSSYLNELEFKFITPDGIDYDFNGQNHSYTLEIYEELEENTLI